MEQDEVKETKVTVVSVKLSRKYDLGFAPYMAYMKSLNGRAPAFGTRDNSNMELDVYLSAELGTEDTVDEVGAVLVDRARGILDNGVAQIMGIAPLPEETEMLSIEKTSVRKVEADY